MGHDLALSSIRQGELSAAEAWKLVSPLVETADRRLASSLCDALRAWTWKALDRRRRDPGLREWADLLIRVDAFLVDGFQDIAAKVELLSELLHESLAVAELAAPEDLLRRKHVGPILRTLTSHGGEWVERASLMDELNLKAANMTRLMSLLADVGWAEQLINGREVVYRISVEGAVQARKLPRGVLPSASVRLRDSKEHKGLERIQAAGRKYHRVLFFTNSTHTRAYHGAKPEVQPWEQDAVDVLGAIENHWSDEEEEGGLEIAVPPAAPVYAMAGARW